MIIARAKGCIHTHTQNKRSCGQFTRQGHTVAQEPCVMPGGGLPCTGDARQWHHYPPSAHGPPRWYSYKKDRSKCFCVQYCKLIYSTKSNVISLSCMDYSLDSLLEAQWFTLELQLAFWQIPFPPQHCTMTTFSTSGRWLYKSKVLPFGLCNALATFA